MLVAIAWLATIVALERSVRGVIASRALGWIAVYGLLAAGVLASTPAMPVSGPWNAVSSIGVVIAAIGYPLGRLALRDRPNGQPEDSAWLEIIALGLFIAPVEEVIWGAIVEPSVGVPLTAAFFAIKHPLVDGRWRRSLGLFLFWLGLSLVRATSWPVALGLHAALNIAGVVRGHRSGQDQF